MPNWDHYCVKCGFNGSYLDFQPQDALEMTQKRCVQPDEDGRTVRAVFARLGGFRFKDDPDGDAKICGGRVRYAY
jgi:hypothetical protein